MRDTPGAFLHGLRLMAVDGTTLEVADTPANVRAFGRPRTQRGTCAYPQLRVVAVIETGTHALCDVIVRPSARRRPRPAGAWCGRSGRACCCSGTGTSTPSR